MARAVPEGASFFRAWCVSTRWLSKPPATSAGADSAAIRRKRLTPREKFAAQSSAVPARYI
jgi:hypothetical protein